MLAVLVGGGVPLFWAIGVSTAARLAPVALVAAAIAPRTRAAWGRDLLWRQLGDQRWMELAGASVLAAASGSTDRILALRYLPATAYGSYYLLYELFSRFWLIPYLLVPVRFARVAAGQDSRAFIRRAWRLTLAAGMVFVAATAAVCFAAPRLLDRLVGIAFGPFTIAFAVAVVVGALTQLRIAELQGAGEARRVTLVVGVCVVCSAGVFFVFIRQMGAPGLLLAWLVKSVVELAATTVGGRGGLASQPV
ncbi:MAG: hypothetical protein ACR2FH_06420 [Caulobacteraceae bacterium]